MLLYSKFAADRQVSSGCACTGTTAYHKAKNIFLRAMPSGQWELFYDTKTVGTTIKIFDRPPTEVQIEAALKAWRAESRKPSKRRPLPGTQDAELLSEMALREARNFLKSEWGQQGGSPAKILTWLPGVIRPLESMLGRQLTAKEKLRFERIVATTVRAARGGAKPTKVMTKKGPRKAPRSRK